MRTGPYSDRVRAKLERMRGVYRPEAQKQRVADIGRAWTMALQGYGWEDIKIASGVDAATARRLIGLHQTA